MRDKLLVAGWAGDLTSDELAYVKAKLKADRRLRALWGFKRGTGRLSDAKIRKAAMDGPQEMVSDESRGPEHEWQKPESIPAGRDDTRGGGLGFNP